MNKIKWLLEKDVFSEDLQPLKDEIIKQGFEYLETEYITFQSRSYDKLFDLNDCVIFYGSLNLALSLQKSITPYPKYVYCTRENYECTKYYAYFGKWLMAQNYIMLPYAELKRKQDWLYEVLGEDGAIFVRPSSGAKIFTGQLVHLENFDREYELLGFYDVDPHAVVVVSEPRNVIKEWRLVIAEDKIIAGSLYSDRTLNLNYEGYTDQVRELAEEILRSTEYRPDPVWTMDFCETKSGDLYLLEIGGFSCAGLYLCDMKPIVREVSRISKQRMG